MHHTAITVPFVALFALSFVGAWKDVVVTVTSTKYLGLEECCAYGGPTAFGAMSHKPTGSPATVPHSKPTSISLGGGGGCVGPSTLGASCADAQGCCGGFTCDSTTLTCVSPDDSNNPSPASVTPAKPSPSSPSGGGDGCVGPSTLGASCADAQGCCGGFSCDSTTLTCVSEDDSSAPAAAPAAAATPSPAAAANGDDDGCVGPSTLGASCADTQGCCGGFSCDSTTLTCTSG